MTARQDLEQSRAVAVRLVLAEEAELPELMQSVFGLKRPVAFYVCAGLAEVAVGPLRPGAGDQFHIDAGGADIDELARSSPDAAGQILAARFITAWASRDQDSALALFRSSDPAGDDSDGRTDLLIAFLGTLTLAARRSAGLMGRHARAALS